MEPKKKQNIFEQCTNFCHKKHSFYCLMVLLNCACYNAAILDITKASSIINVKQIEIEQTENRLLETINGTLNYRLYDDKKVKDDKLWLDGRALGLQRMKCVRRANCEKLKYSQCLGAKLPYEYTSLDLTISPNQKDVEDRLNKYQVLRHVPKCWAVIQPFLCAVLVPKCEQINGNDMVYLPSLEMCRITLEPCRILYNTNRFPEFLHCNETHYPSKCSNDVREMKFNLSGQCLEPLVAAESPASYHSTVDGCGVRCKDPLYTDDEHRQIHKLVAWGSSLCFLANLFVVVTFLIDWENASKYPALIVFYINMCFLIACLGWLTQFTPGSQEDIVCRKDGTLRHSEPTAGQNLSCVVVFVIIYYFLVAAMIWFVFLTYAWHLRAVGNFQDRIDKKGSYFHLIAWSLPLVLTITTLALSEVDGNSIVGICFVGYINHSIRAGLVLGPLIGVILIGGYFIIRGMILLFALKRFANVIKSTMASNKIHTIIVRMGWCATLTLLFILGAVGCHVYEFMWSSEWSESLKQYIICRIFSPFDEHVTCKIDKRPSVSILQLHLLCLFGAGIAMSSWCWTPSSLEAWKRYVRRICGRELLEEVKMPKHKVIAQTWAKRKEFEDKGRLSITLCNTHTDPVGLNFDAYDINSSETVEISSTWVNYLPKCVKRRMALTLATNSSSQGPRKTSVDSEISFSVRHVSVESRRTSADSQVSVKIAEMKTKVAARTTTTRNSHRNKRSSAMGKRGQKRKDFIISDRKRGRKESSTSIESQIIGVNNSTFSYINQNTKNKHNKQVISQNDKRRTLHADPTDIAKFLTKNGELILPFFKNQPMCSSSDVETSQSIFKIKNSPLNLVLKSDNVVQNLNEEFHRKDIHKMDDKPQSYLKKPSNCEETISNESLNRTIYRNSAVINKQYCKSTVTNTSSKFTNKKRSNKRKRNSTSSVKYKRGTASLEISDLNIGGSVDHKNHNLEEPYCEGDGMPYDSTHISDGKENFHSSKMSCDVGIQTLNAYDATNNSLDQEKTCSQIKHCQQNSNTPILQDDSENLRHQMDKEENEKDFNESSTLLPNNPAYTILSEADKLKLLLLPSK